MAAHSAVARLMEILQELLIGAVAPAPVNLSLRVMVKPLTYDGSKDVEWFLNQIHVVAELGKWPKNIRLLQLREVLKYLAYEVGREETAEEIFKALKARFGLCSKEETKQLSALKRCKDNATATCVDCFLTS